MKTGANSLDLLNAFDVWFYEWCLKQTEEEVGIGFSRIRKIHNSAATAYVKSLSSLKTPAQLNLARTLVKRFHPHALELVNETFSLQEKTLVDHFLSRNQLLTDRGWGIEPDPRVGSAPQTRSAINRKLLKAEIKKRLDPWLGSSEHLGGGTWRYTLEVRQLVIQTDIDVGGRRPLTYLHAVTAQGKLLHQWISFLQWHGITSQTSWNTMQPGDEEPSAELLQQVCIRFLRAVEAFAHKV